MPMGYACALTGKGVQKRPSLTNCEYKRRLANCCGRRLFGTRSQSLNPSDSSFGVRGPSLTILSDPFLEVRHSRRKKVGSSCTFVLTSLRLAVFVRNRPLVDRQKAGLHLLFGYRGATVESAMRFAIKNVAFWSVSLANGDL
jgi:hypothetical protein